MIDLYFMSALISNFFQKEFFLNLVNTIKTKDILDILFSSFIFYFIIDILKKTRNFAIIIGILSIIIIFTISSWLHLPLTYKILQTFFNVFIIILVVVFQNEIRKFFETIGIFRVSKKLRNITPTTLDIITKTVFLMAEKKIGALIIFPGKQPLENHILAGKNLNGEITEEILLSIFDTHSPGHDGAIIIKNNKIVKFGVYLPLSQNTDQLEKYGTRHRAALGITERTDCLAIVVSEEKGIVSIAHFGKLEKINTKSELKEKLREFLQIETSKGFKKRLKRFLKSFSNEFFVFILALFISFFAWIVLNYNSIGYIQRNFILPVEIINIPPTISVESVKPIELIGTFSGKEKDFNFIESENLKIVIDMKDNQQVGVQKIKVDEEKIRYGKDNKKLPKEISLVKLEPNYIQLTVKKKEEKQ